MQKSRIMLRHAVAATALSCVLAACGGGSSAPAPDVPTPAPQLAPVITLSAPPAPTLAGGKPLPITSTLSQAADVSWSLAAGAPGSLSAASGATVNYLPPPSVGAITSITVVASAGSSKQSYTFRLYPDPGPAGISLLAGAPGGNGIVDGSGTAARLKNVYSMAADGQGNAYLVDDHAVRLVTAAGAVSTLHDYRLRDGKAGGYFPDIRSVSIAPDGKAYLLWWWRDTKISLFDSQGQLHDIATLARASKLPNGLLAAGGGVFYVFYDNHIVRVGADGSQSTFAGAEQQSAHADGSGGAARFRAIHDYALDAGGTLYVADGYSIRSISPAGVVATLAGSGASASELAVDGDGSAARFGGPGSLALDDSGKLLVLDRLGIAPDAFGIRSVSKTGTVSTVFSGTDPATGSKDSLLRSSGGKLLLGAGGRIDSYAAGKVSPLAGLEDDTTVAADGMGAAARFQRPAELAADANGNLYVLDMVYDAGDASKETKKLEVRRVSPDGKVSTLVSQRLGTPSGMAADAAGNAYIAIQPMSALLPQGSAIYRVTPFGEVQLVAGQPLAAGAIRDGLGIDARFNKPRVEGIDSQGNVIVRDKDPATGLDSWRSVTPAGAAITFGAGQPVPATALRDSDGAQYIIGPSGAIVRASADGSTSEITGDGQGITVPGELPGRVTASRVIPWGPHALAVIAGRAIVKIVLPH